MSEAARTVYFDYVLVLLQTLTMVGYILPWFKGGDGAVVEAYSDLAHDPTETEVEMSLIVIGCFLVTLVALVFTCYMVWGEDLRRLAPRTASISASVALAGPLVYAQSLLPFDPGWSDFSERLPDMSVGWSLAVLFGTLTALVGVYLLSIRYPGDLASSRTCSTHGIRNSILIVVLACGSAIALIGYFQVWSEGVFSTMYGTITLSRGGDWGPLMCLVLIASGLALSLGIWSQMHIDRSGLALLYSSRCAALTGLSLTVFWGVAMGEYELSVPGLTSEASLQPGWYILLAGQTVALASLTMVQHGGWRAADSDRE